MTINDFLGKLQGVKHSGADKWEARCPCSFNHKHGDKNRSLSVKYDSITGNILVYCHTGCTIDEICGAIGCGKDELMAQPTEQEKMFNFLEYFARKKGLILKEVYSYDYGQFNDGLAKVRFCKADGKKDFRWISYSPSNKSGFKMSHEDCPHRLYFSGNVKPQ